MGVRRSQRGEGGGGREGAGRGPFPDPLLPLCDTHLSVSRPAEIDLWVGDLGITHFPGIMCSVHELVRNRREQGTREADAGASESLASSASPGSGCRSELGSGTANCAFAGAGVVLPSCPGEAGGPPSRVHSPPRPRATGPRPGQAGPRPPRELPPPPLALWALPMTSARSEAVQAESLLLSDPPACISAVTGFTTSGK